MYKICTDKKLSAILPRASASQCLPLFGRLSANLPPASVSSFRDPSANIPLGVLRILVEPLWKRSWGSVDLLPLISLGIPWSKEILHRIGARGRAGLTHAGQTREIVREPSADLPQDQSPGKFINILSSPCGKPSSKRIHLILFVDGRQPRDILCGWPSTRRLA